MTDRPDASTITDDQLDALYAERDDLRARLYTAAWYAANERELANRHHAAWRSARHRATEHLAGLDAALDSDTTIGTALQLGADLRAAEARITAARHLCALLTPAPDEEQPFRLGQAHAARHVLDCLAAQPSN